MPMVFKMDNMDNVTIKQNIAYKNTGKAELHMDVYAPEKVQEKSKLPAVIFIHGEAARKGLKDSGQSLSIGKLIAASEIIGVSFNHRTLTEAYSDIIDLINYIRENAEKYNVDKDRIAIWATSGGVPYGISAGLMDNADYIKALAAYYGPMDFSWFGIEREEETDVFSPINLIDSQRVTTISPIYIAIADNDSMDISLSLTYFGDKATELGAEVYVQNHPEGDHAFDIFNDDDRSKGSGSSLHICKK